MKQCVKLLSIFGLFSLCSTTLAPHTFAFSGGGNGTSPSPYEIGTCTQLQEARQELAAHYKLISDIDCTDVSASPGWAPIGFVDGSPFTGALDGDGYTISNIDYAGNGPAGVFGYISHATISNVTVRNSVFDSVGHVGGIAGDVSNSALEHVHVHNTTVKADNRLGGLVGIMSESTVSDSSVADGAITGKELGFGGSHIEGAAGHVTNSTFNRVSVAGVVTGNESTSSSATQIGGFIGTGQFVVIQDSYTTATVTGGSKIGGFIGSASSVTTRRSWASGDIAAVTDVGGFIGYEGLSPAENSFSLGKVSGTTNVGGFIGHAVATGVTMDSSYWDVERSEQSSCVGLDDSTAPGTSCLGLNAGNAAPNYFFNTSSNIPFNSWDFTNVWRTTSTTPLLITSPARPDNVTVSRTSNTLGVAWENPADNGGSVITSYDLKYRKSDSSTNTTISGLPTPSYTITGLDADTWYTVEVRANNATGKGTWLGFITTTLTATSTPAASSTPATPAAIKTNATKDTVNPTSDNDFLDTLTNGEIKQQDADTVTNNKSTTEDTPSSDTEKDTTGSNTAAKLIVAGLVATLGVATYLLRPRFNK
jgi:Fibronectin type III domain